MGKRKSDKKPKKLTDFYPSASSPSLQDGTEASCLRRSPQHGADVNSPAQLAGGSRTHGSGGSTLIPTPSSSLQKSSQKRSEGHMYAGELEESYDSQNSTRDFVEQIHGVPLSDTIMRDMLVTLRGSLHKDMMMCVSQIKQDVSALGAILNYVEWRKQ